MWTTIFACLWFSGAIAQSDVAVTPKANAWEKGYDFSKVYPTGNPLDLPFNPPENSLPVEWRNLGPNEQPVEQNPGGRAIPTYSAGRGNGTGRINFLHINPNRPEELWACSPTGGLFHTTDGGEHWQVAGTDALPISGVASIDIHPRKKGDWILATGDSDDRFMFSDGIWRTTDAGKHWTNINGSGKHAFPVSPLNWEWTQVGKIVVHPCIPDRAFVASNKGLYRTDNLWDAPGKVRWKKVAEGYYYDIEILPWNPSQVFAGGEFFCHSSDCGSTFQRLPSPPTDVPVDFAFKRLSLECSPADPEHLYVAALSSKKPSMSAAGEGFLLTYGLEDGTWSTPRSLKKGMGNMTPTRARAFAVSPVDAQVMLAANVQPVYRSTDGSASFERVEKRQMHDDVHHLLFHPNGTTAYASHDGGVSWSTDGGLTWSNRDRGIGVANIFGLSVAHTEADQVLYGGYDVGCNLLRDGTWRHVSWGDGFETITDPRDPDWMVVTKQNGHLNRSADAHDFDASVNCRLNNTFWHTWIRQNPSNGDIYCSGDKLGRSRNGGDDWEIICDPRTFDPEYINAFHFYLSEAHPEVMYLYAVRSEYHRPAMLRTFNVNAPADSIVWEEIPLPRENWIGGLAVDPEDPTRCWMTYTGYESPGKFWYFDGEMWHDQSANLGSAVVESMCIDERRKRLYLGSNHGVWSRPTDGTTWQHLSGLPGTFIKSLAVNPARQELVVATFGRGVWSGPLLP